MTITPAQLKSILQMHWRDPALRKHAIYIEGPSGIGKSEVVQSLAEEEKTELRDRRFSQLDAVDLTGVPFSVNGFTRFAPPEWLYFEDGKGGILFADEITSAQPGVHAASYQLFLERRVGDVKIPDDVMIIAAGNRVSDRGVVNPIPAPLLNRFVKLEVEPNLDAWRDIAAERNVDPRMIAWISHQPQFLHDFDPEQAVNSEPFSSPRSLMRAATYLGLDPSLRVEMLNGTIGKVATASLESFLRLEASLPKYEEVRADPMGCRIPDAKQLGERYAVSMMVSARMDRENFRDLWRYVDRMGGPMVVLAVRLAVKRDKNVMLAKGYADFHAKHQDAFKY